MSGETRGERRRPRPAAAQALGSTFVLALLTAALASPLEAQVRQPRVGVMELQEAGQVRPWGSGTMGAAVTDMLTNELTRVGRFSVVERTQLASLMQEYKLKNTGVLDAKTAAEVGRVLGIDAMIVGSVTQATLSHRKVGVGSVGVKRAQAEMWLEVRLVSAKTAEIIVAITEKGNAGNFGGQASTEKVGHTSFEDSNEAALIMNAAREAVQRVAKAFAAKADRIEMVAPAVWQAGLARRGDKVFVQNGYVFVEAGVIKGIQIGERLEVVRVDKSVSIPIHEVVAVIEVVDNMVADGQASRCRLLSGAVASLRVDDAVRRAAGAPRPPAPR